ncbi:PTS sugar transporter subunit IIA [Alkalihalophilus lindianensis]|uniref:Mannitol-specific phosphotransferase enzyme IIA component n=1 Tax=Alkalihalophilus lindianensis TaxID=1630542 RepID=A0ABU3X958_9BACI|nr:PTS sugar transporter subunit IIA [Alkalihalophilus lindianensis]MDV2684182.1 PTS sugar transporter subunit IIA [Alkalihalophilus lindianensis]
MAKAVLQLDNILFDEQVQSKEEAIRKVGGLLIENGYVNEEYVNKMMDREALTTTYMGNFLAIPHGTEEAKKEVVESGITIMLLDKPIDWDGNEVKLVIGIAGKGDEHLSILSNIAITCSDEETLEQILSADSKETLMNFFQEVE